MLFKLSLGDANEGFCTQMLPLTTQLMKFLVWNIAVRDEVAAKGQNQKERET